jgi:hypothetical protein
MTKFCPCWSTPATSGVAFAARRGVQPAKLGFLALDANGVPGSCCTVGTNFQYAVARAGRVELLRATEIGK